MEERLERRGGQGCVRHHNARNATGSGGEVVEPHREGLEPCSPVEGAEKWIETEPAGLIQPLRAQVEVWADDDDKQRGARPLIDLGRDRQGGDRLPAASCHREDAAPARLEPLPSSTLLVLAELDIPGEV